MSCGHPDPAASTPSPREEEGSATRKRIAYSRDFLISVGTSSEACRKLPVGLDASALRELSLVETGSSRRYVAPFGRLGAACSSGSNTDIKSNQLDMHPGKQCRHDWQSKEHDRLLGSGAFPRIPCYAGSLASNDQGRGYQLVTRNAGGYQPTRQYKAPPVSQKNVGLINTETFGSFENWNKDRVEEERKRRASFELIRKEQPQALQEEKKSTDSDKENLGGGIIFVQNSAGKRDLPTKSDKQGGLNVSSLPKEEAIKTAPLLPTPTTSPPKPLGFTHRLPHQMLQIQSFNTSSNSEIQQLNTEDVTESAILDQRFSGGDIPGSGQAETLSPKQMGPLSHSKCGPVHTIPGTVVECDNPTFSGLSQESAIFDEDGVEIHLPEEDTLFSVHDFLPTQNTDDWSASERARAEGVGPEDKVVDLNYRLQSLDVLQPQFHVLPVPCAGLAAPHHILQHTTMPASFLPPQGFQSPLPLPQPVHRMPDYTTEMTGANSLQMYYYQPGYGETAMMMAGPSVQVNQAGAFDRPVQVELRGRSSQMHPTLAAPVHGFYEHADDLIWK